MRLQNAAFYDVVLSPMPVETQLTQYVDAPPARVYQAFVTATAVASWMVPDDMTSQIHEFDAREGGSFRISLTYDAPNAAGKTAANTDTYHGHFVKLVPDKQVVQVMEFESSDPTMQGEMTATFTLVGKDQGTEVHALHENLPPGIPPEANELGWRLSLEKLARFVEER